MSFASGSVFDADWSKRTYGGEATEPQDGRLRDQPGNAAACFTHVAICASSSLSPSRMSMYRVSLPLLAPGGTGRSDVPRKEGHLDVVREGVDP